MARLGLSTERHEVDSLVVRLGCIEVVPKGDRQIVPILLYDAALSINGAPSSRGALAAWFLDMPGVSVEIDRDERRYGHVVAARFSAASSPH